MIWVPVFLIGYGLAFYFAFRIEKGYYSFYMENAVAKLVALVFACNVLFLIFIAPNLDTRRSPFSGDDCYVEWDGRSNPVVCD